MRGVVVTIPGGPASGSVVLSERAYPGLVGARRAVGANAASAGVYGLQAGNHLLTESYTDSHQIEFDVEITPGFGGLTLTYSLSSAPFTSFPFTLFVE